MSNYLIEEKRRKSWSFCIAFGGDTTNLHKVIDSIRALNIPSYEILIAEERLTLKLSGDVRIIESGSDREGWITKKKNMMIKEARYENICLLHDYIQFKPDWYKAYCNFQEDWNICSNQIYNPFRNERVADWMTLDHPKYGVSLLPYEERGQSKYMFLSGLYFLVKKTFILENDLLLDENLVWGEAEDQEWSKRARMKTVFSFNKDAVVTTLKDKHFDFLNEADTRTLFEKIKDKIF